MIDNKNQILLELHLLELKIDGGAFSKKYKKFNHNKLIKRKTKKIFGYKLYTSKTKSLCTIDLT